jgi:hypothetical protein
MDTLVIEYSVRNEIIGRILQAFSKMAGAKIKREYVPTKEEQEAIDKALKSGISNTDISELQKLLRS